MLPSAIKLSGTIRAAHVVGVSAPVPGYIDVFLVNVGDEVYAGQELARIGNAGLESDRAQAQAGLDATERAVAAAQLRPRGPMTTPSSCTPSWTAHRRPTTVKESL